MLTSRRNHPGTAAVLSFVFTGLGQIYNGQLRKGFVLAGISMAALLAVIVSAVVIGYWLMDTYGITPAVLAAGCVFFIVSVLVIAVSGIYSITDAYKTALKR
jgi:TM2 domain-containing membrane protein YozV